MPDNSVFKIKSFLAGKSKSDDKVFLEKLKTITFVKPGNFELFKQAFRHNSIYGVQKNLQDKLSNERLEYLGDAVLGLVVGNVLYTKFPTANEGFLTEMRSKMVSREKLSEIALKMGLPELLEYDKHLRNSAIIKSLAGNALEALIGAIYLDKGYDKAHQYIVKHIIANHLDIASLVEININHKGTLLSWAQKNKKNLRIELIEIKDQRPHKLYISGVYLNDDLIASGTDSNKRKSEQIAAELAYEILKNKE